MKYKIIAVLLFSSFVFESCIPRPPRRPRPRLPRRPRLHVENKMPQSAYFVMIENLKKI